MASTQVVLEFLGDDGPLKKALDGVERKTSAVLGAIGKMGKIGAGASAFVGTANGVLTLGAALTTIAPAALALPGIILGGAVALQTAKLAFSGFGDAVKGDAEALAKFGKEGQAAARVVKGLDGQFQTMRKAVSEEMFRGLAPEIAKTGSALLKLGTNELPAVSKGFNGIAKEALVMARGPVFQDDLSVIIGNTAGMLEAARPSVAGFVSGFAGLGNVGSKLLPGIGYGIADVSERFKAWVDHGIESGSIEDSLDRAIDGLQRIGTIIGTVGSIFATVWGGINAGLGAGATPLDMLAVKVQVFLTALQSPTAQEFLRRLGEAIRAISDAFNAVLPVLLEIAFTIGGALLPVVTGLATVVEQNAGFFAGLVVAVLALVGAIQLVTAVVGIVKGAIAAWTAVQWLLNVAMSANPIGLVIIAVMALVAILIYAWNNSETFRAIVTAAWEGIKTAIGAVIDFVVSVVTGFIDGLIAGWNAFAAANEAVWSAVSGAIGSAVDFITGLWDGVASFFAGIPDRIGAALGSIGSIIGGIFKGALNGAIGWVNWGIDRINGLIAGINSVGSFVGLSIPSIPHVPTFHTGGIVPGAPGSETLALLQAGEKVTPAGRVSTSERNGTAGGGSGAVAVTFAGNTSDALATVIMMLIRTGKIQIKAA